MRVLYFGTYDTNYGRNRILADGLAANGVEVSECHIPLWQGTEDKVRKASGRWLNLGFLVKVITTYARLLRMYWPMRGSYDVMMLGYAGQVDALIARPLTWLARRPLVLDLYMSLYLIVCQRGLDRTHRLTSRLVYALEWLACRLPDRLILDTVEYRRYFCETFHISPARFRLVPAGADDRFFHPLSVALPPPSTDGALRVIFIGTFIPRGHGVEAILGAAALLRDHAEVSFELVGDGQDRTAMMDLAASLQLTNVRFIGWTPKEELATRVAEADIVLGVFGTTRHVAFTIPNKIFEGMAMRKPVITADGPAIRQTLQHGVHVYLVPANDATALAQAILHLQEDPALAASLAENGYAKVMAEHTVAALGCRLADHLAELRGREAA